MKNLVVLTGAGISKESGLATFRDKDGLWTNEEWVHLASTEALCNETQKCLDFYNWRRKQLSEVEPNLAHIVLAELERFFNVTIITQNVDDLHERAGSTSVLHLHGELRKVTSSKDPNDLRCIVEKPLDEPILVGEEAADGSQLRPFIVLFGENVPNMPQAEMIAMNADIFVVIGTSLQVYPAASLTNFASLDIPRFVIDPGEFSGGVMYDFEHIKTTAVAGIDILKEKLRAL